MAKDYSRTQRIGDQMQRELAQLIQREIKDPRLGLVTITGVEVSRDVAHAKVFITVMGQDDAGKIALNMEILNDAAGYLRMLLGKSMKLRSVPQLHFHYDESIRRGAELKRIRRSISGILVLDKPRGMSSNQALQKVRWLLNAEKAGHTGSLDPLATGVLPLCFGEATKFSQYLLDADKGYETVMRMGITTTTGDAEGELLAERDVTVGRDDLEQALPRFRGDIEQVPPMYSALKKDGQPLYKLARAGEVVEREARSVTITRLDLLSFEPPCATLAVSCSKGTYVRTLVEDLGQVLGCGAHVAALRRTQAGPFALAQAITLETLERVHAEGGPEALDQFLMPEDSGLLHWPVLQLSEHSAYYWLHGQPVRAPEAPKFGWLRVQDHTGRFIGIGEVTDDGRIAPRRLIRS